MPAPSESQVFDLRLSPLTLEAGASIDPHLVRGWWWGPASDLPALQRRTRVLPAEAFQRQSFKVVGRTRREQLDAPVVHPDDSLPAFDPSIPTVLAVHALTGDMRAGGPQGWWEPVIGPGRALDPTRCRILCFNNVGSCYGTSGPPDEGFPAQSGDPRIPAAVTTWDQARSILAALDRLGIEKVALVTGGSVGGMVALCLAALAPERFERLAPIAACEAASSWIVGWNHVARQAVLLDPEFPESASRGLQIARQIAMLTYRAEPGLDERQGRAQTGTKGWSAEAPFRMGSYLEHQGVKLRDRFHAGAYLALIGSMDHHDLGREPGSGTLGGSWGVDRIKAKVLSVDIDTDELFLPVQMHRLAARLRERGVRVEEQTIRSPHGHDAFLIEWDQVDAVLRRALAL